MYPSSLKFSFESYILIRAQEVPEIHQLADTQAAILQSCSRDSQYSLQCKGFEVPDRRNTRSSRGKRGLLGDSVRGQSALHHSRQESYSHAERHDSGQENQRRILLLVDTGL